MTSTKTVSLSKDEVTQIVQDRLLEKLKLAASNIDHISYDLSHEPGDTALPQPRFDGITFRFITEGSPI